MRSPVSLQIPVYDIPREPGERVRPVTVIHTDDLTAQRKIWLAPHRKNYFLIKYATAGSGRQWVDMLPYEFSNDTLFFSIPGQVHCKEDLKTAGTVICFTSDFFAISQNADLLRLPFIRNIQFSNQLKLTPDDQTELQGMLHNIVKEYLTPGDLHDEMVYAHLRVLLLRLGRIYNQQYQQKTRGLRHELYRRFQQCIENHFKTTTDARAYADMLNISASHLNALIREQSGKTVTIHLHERQMLEAKRLLFHTNMSVKQIAFELGFRDTSYFNRFFKRNASVTPLEYRADTGEF